MQAWEKTSLLQTCVGSGYAVMCISICISVECVVMLCSAKWGEALVPRVWACNSCCLCWFLLFCSRGGGVRGELVSVMSFCRRVSQELWELHEGTASGNCHDFDVSEVICGSQSILQCQRLPGQSGETEEVCLGSDAGWLLHGLPVPRIRGAFATRFALVLTN